VTSYAVPLQGRQFKKGVTLEIDLELDSQSDSQMLYSQQLP